MSRQLAGRPLTRRKFLSRLTASAIFVFASALFVRVISRTRKEKTVWQIDPAICTHCSLCETSCVLTPSASKCVQAYDICGYCELCFGYFTPEARTLTPSAENRLCPVDAIKREFVESPYYEYSIVDDRCIGCARCVKNCTTFGNGSFFLQINHGRCVNCNECSIAKACPSNAIRRVSSLKPYLLKGKGKMA